MRIDLYVPQNCSCFSLFEIVDGSCSCNYSKFSLSLKISANIKQAAMLCTKDML